MVDNTCSFEDFKRQHAHQAKPRALDAKIIRNSEISLLVQIIRESRRKVMTGIMDPAAEKAFDDFIDFLVSRRE